MTIELQEPMEPMEPDVRQRCLAHLSKTRTSPKSYLSEKLKSLGPDIPKFPHSDVFLFLGGIRDAELIHKSELPAQLSFPCITPDALRFDTYTPYSSEFLLGDSKFTANVLIWDVLYKSLPCPDLIILQHLGAYAWSHCELREKTLAEGKP